MNVSEKLRLVQGLHSHAEMFGFKWDDDSDWTWHDVACKIADEVDAENDKLRELVRAAWRCIHTGASCSDCRLIAGGCTLQTAMRELGVEVDG